MDYSTKSTSFVTRAEWEEGNKTGYEYEIETRAVERGLLDLEIQRLKEELKAAKKKKANLKHISFKQYCQHHNYESDVLRWRKQAIEDGFGTIIENEDTRCIVESEEATK